jgi:cellobiose phosphorylase
LITGFPLDVRFTKTTNLKKHIKIQIQKTWNFANIEKYLLISEKNGDKNDCMNRMALRNNETSKVRRELDESMPDKSMTKA